MPFGLLTTSRRSNELENSFLNGLLYSFILRSFSIQLTIELILELRLDQGPFSHNLRTLITREITQIKLTPRIMMVGFDERVIFSKRWAQKYVFRDQFNERRFRPKSYTNFSVKIAVLSWKIGHFVGNWFRSHSLSKVTLHLKEQIKPIIY